MKSTLKRLALWVAVLAVGAWAQTPAPVQSSARPFGLDVAGPVMIGGSDAASLQFGTNYLPMISDWVQNLPESQAPRLEDFPVNAVQLDPGMLEVANDVDMRVYFISEGAAYHNTLGYSLEGPGLSGNDPTIIFPDQSVNWGAGDIPPPVPQPEGRTQGEPLMPGDFVDIGTIAGGSTLDLWIGGDAARNENTDNVYSLDESANLDGLNHVLMWAIEDSPYILVAYEDIFGGGDMDFNDLILVVNLGPIEATVPEPATIALLGGFLALGGWARKRRQAAKA